MNFPIKKNGVPILKKEDMEALAEQLLVDYDKRLIIKANPVPIEEIIEKYFGLEIDYKNLDKSGNTLGLTAFDDGYLRVYNPDIDQEEQIWVSKGTIIIDNQLVEEKKLLGRYRFTCSHETSHWVLHRQKYEINMNQTVLFETTNQIEIRCLNRNIEHLWCQDIRSDEDWMEWQADYMGGAILMPLTVFRNEFISLLRKLHIRHDYLYVDSQPCNFNNFKIVLNNLASRFNVSKKAVEVRLSQLNLLKKPEVQMHLWLVN